MLEAKNFVDNRVMPGGSGCRAAGKGPRMGTDRSMKLNDIARLAGVSRSTVSRVVNDDPRVSDDVRRRVQETIAEVGYQPNAAARALASRRTGIIGLVIPKDFATVHSDPWFPPLIQACLDAARDVDLSVMLLMESVEDPEAVQRLVQRFVRARTLDGLVLSNSLDDDVLVPELQQTGFPYVLIGRPVSPGRNFVDITNRTSSADIVRHMLQHGRTRPAMINGPEVVIPALDRRLGFQDAVREAGIDPSSAPVISVEFSRPGALGAALDLLSRDDRPDCIYAASDSIALAVMEAARRLGIRVPEELGIVGFDDVMPERNERVGLTTVRQPVREMAAAAVRLLNDLIHHRTEPPVEMWLESTLSIRHSCGCDWSGLVSEDVAERKEGATAPA